MSMLYTFMSVSIGPTGTKPDRCPGLESEVRFFARGLQGSAKDDSVTVWFCNDQFESGGRFN